MDQRLAVAESQLGKSVNILFLLFVVVLGTAMVTLFVSALVRNRFFAVTGSFAISEFTYWLLMVHSVDVSPVASEFVGIAATYAVLIAPIILLTSWSVVRAARPCEEGKSS